MMNWKTKLWLLAAIATVTATEITKVETNTILTTTSAAPEVQPRDHLLRDDEISSETHEPSSSSSSEENTVTDGATQESNEYPATTQTTSSHITETDDSNEATDTVATTVTSVGTTVPPVIEASNERSIEVDDLTIETDKGAVRGIQWRGTTDIRAFLDIPYGHFDYHFEAPKEPETWDETLLAGEHTKRCPQLDGDAYVGETDCLTLSIFTPLNAVNTSVLFYIHESNFISGSGDPAVYGPEFLVPKNIILVLPNYRLGPLGFLCLKNDTAPGNAGLKDLALALKWTEKNIMAFGGNPLNIAVGGDGTSAALAGYLALAPTSRDFVKKVISDSGSVLAHWAIDRDPISTAQELVDSIVSNNNEGELLGEIVFQNVSLEHLLISAKDIIMRPCIENDGFLVDSAWSIIHEENIHTTFLIGSANHAGLVEALQHNETSITMVTENFATILPNDLMFDSTEERDKVGEILKGQYFNDGNITLEHSEGLSLYHTDASYLGPTIRVARALANAGATVFLYEFSFIGSLNRELVTMEDAPPLGAVRGDIAGYLFALDGRVPDEGTTERQMVDLLVELWVNFLQTREPASNDIDWQPLKSTGTEDWLSIGEETQLETGSFHQDRLTLWTDIYRDHFIDSNMAFGLAPSFTILVVAIMSYVTLIKM